MDSIIDENNNNPKTHPQFKNKQKYIGGTNEKTRESDDYPSDTDGCASNLGDGHKKNMKNALKLHLKKMIVLNKKVVKG